jgi:hypothetical protein
MRAALLVLCLGLAGCITFQLERNNQFAPVDKAALESLRPGETTLAECLELFGAPLWVREHRTYGLELAYGWHKNVDWGISASVPLTDYYSASVRYDETETKMRGLVLLFDEQETLSIMRTGFLRDIAPTARPAYVEPEDAAEDGGA